MQKQIRSFVAVSILTAGLLAAYVTTGAERKREAHPHIHKAIAELEETKRELKEADHDFGGHRVAAIKQCDEALAQLRQCLKFDRK